MRSLTGTWFQRLLEHLAQAVFHYPKVMVIPQVVLAVGCVLYTVQHLQFDSNRSSLVGANKKYHNNYMRFRKEFPLQDDLVVIVESENSDKNRQFVERLSVKVEAETNLFKDVFYKGDLKLMGNKALLFVPETNLVTLEKTLETYRPLIEQFTQATNLVSLFSRVNTQFRTAKRETNAETTSLIKALPALERIVTQAEDSLDRPGTPPSPGIDALLGAGQEAQQKIYITFDRGRLYLLTAHAPSKSLNHKSVERLRELVRQMQMEVPGVNVGVTGEPVLERDEMRQSEKDTTIASVLTLVICTLIFIYGYHETGRPIKATLCLLVGVAYTMGFTTLTIGHLNILTITFVPILIGLAIDYAVHLITRYEEELRRGRPEREALTKAIVFTGQGIFTGAFTTAGAFLAMGLTDFKGIREMGIICGGGLLVCLVPMMTMLPVMLLRGRQNVIDHQQGDPFARRARIESIWLDRPLAVIGVTLALCGLAATQFHKIQFDYNLLNMQTKGLPAVAYERKLIASAGKSVLFGAVLAESVEEARALEAKIQPLPSVAAVESMSRFLTEDQTRKLQIIGEIKREVAPIRFADYDPGPVEASELTATLYYLQGFCGLAGDEAEKQETEIARQLLSLRDAINSLRKRIIAEPERAAGKLAAFQQALFTDVRDTFRSLAQQDNRDRLKAEDLPPALRDRFVGITGMHLLQVYPKKDVWQRENQREFITELRTALTPNDLGSPDSPVLFQGLLGKLRRLAGTRDLDSTNAVVKPVITGTPVQLYEYTGLLVNSFFEAAWYSLAAIMILVYLHFRTFSSVILALMPVAVGAIWLAGLMGYFGLPLNPANIMTLPLVIGIGVTNGIHILNRFAEEKTPSILSKSTGKAVLVSGLTAIAGFGSLIIAKHQGIQSLGLLMSAGIATCMVAGLTALPAVMSLVVPGVKAKEEPSADNA